MSYETGHDRRRVMRGEPTRNEPLGLLAHFLAPDDDQPSHRRLPAPELPSSRLVLTIEEAADRLGVGRTLMYALVRSGAVESVSIGRLRRIPVDALETFVASLREQRAQSAS